MSIRQHGFWWKLFHLAFGKTDADYARDALVRKSNGEEVAALERSASVDKAQAEAKTRVEI